MAVLFDQYFACVLPLSVRIDFGGEYGSVCFTSFFAPEVTPWRSVGPGPNLLIGALCLMIDDDMETDALEIAKSSPDFAKDICGIVPQFGGKCFDIILNTAEAAVKLADTGYDYGEIRKPLRLLGAKTVHVSIFVSMEFPDEDLLSLLEKYGELKTRRLHFQEEGFTHIERGVRVTKFIKISRDIPKRVVLTGIELGFKYSGQPTTCYRCHSTEHVVKDCPKRRNFQTNPPPTVTW